MNKIRNKAAYIKGSLFSNNQFRDEELQLNFAINSIINALNVSNVATDFKNGIVKIINIETQIKRFRNFWPKGMYHCNLDVTIISPTGPTDSRDIKLIFENSHQSTAERNNQTFLCFPNKVEIGLKPRDVLK